MTSTRRDHSRSFAHGLQRSLRPLHRWAIVLVAACQGRAGGDAGPLRSEVAELHAQVRPFVERLSTSGRWQRCDAYRAQSWQLPNRCSASAMSVGGTRSASQRVALASRVAGQLRHERSVDATWSSALLDIYADAGDGRVIDRAASHMSDVLATDSSNAFVLNDLAVALLARLPYRGDPADLLVAVDLLEHAARIDSLSTVIAYNRASALERAHLVAQARVQWVRYVSLERDRSWREEGARRLAALPVADHDSLSVQPASRSAPDGTNGPSNQRRRETVLDSILPQWSALVRRGAVDTSRRLLDDALVESEELSRRSGDSTALVVVHEALAASREQSRIIKLSSLVGAYGDGRRAIARDQFGGAKSIVQLEGDPGDDSPAIALCLDELRGTLEVFFADYARAERRFGRILASPVARPMRALRARAHWARALARARQGRLGPSERDYAAAAAIYDSIGEATNLSIVESQRSDVLFLLGQEEEATRAMLASLASLDTDDASARHAVLTVFGLQLSDASFPYAAAAVRREMLWWAGRTRRPRDLVQSLARLAMDEMTIGDSRDAERLLGAARAAMRDVSDSAAAERLRVDIARAEASLDRSVPMRTRIGNLDVVDEYLRRKGIAIERVGVLVDRAALRLQVADTTRAEQDLLTASLVADSLVAVDLDPGVLRSARDARHRVFRLLVEIDLARGDSLAAFRDAARSRSMVASRDGARRDIPRLAPGTVALAYAVLPGAVACWLVTTEGLHQRVVPVREDSLEQLVVRFTDALQADDTTLVAAIGGVLATILLPQALDSERTWREVLILPDGPLARLPFAALPLHDTRPLLEIGAVRYAENLGAARRTPAEYPGQTIANGQRVLVGVPAVDRTLFPDLPALAGVDAEVHALAALYPGAVTLDGAGATRRAVLRAMSGARLLHFAGHARIALAMPERSHLVLAHDSSSAGGIAADVIFASDIARLKLATLRLVILSSCGTVQPRMRRATSASGLAEAFLDAGAEGVVSGLWEADDGSTSDLMVRVHSAYQRLGDGAAALHSAQLELSRSDRGHPSRWSAFRYQGK